MIDARWAAFHEEFPFPYFSTSFLTNDIESFDLLCTLYNAIHGFYFANKYAVDLTIGRIMDQVTVINVDIIAQFYDWSLQHPSYNESQSDENSQSINRISSGPQYHQ